MSEQSSSEQRKAAEEALRQISEELKTTASKLREQEEQSSKPNSDVHELATAAKQAAQKTLDKT